MTMTTIRVKKDARYFSASNEPFNDKRLSWEARGLMGYLLSKPNDWEVRKTDLEKQGPAGDYKIRRMLAELRKHGYMNRIRITKEGGKFDWITEVYESPSQNPRPQAVTSGGKSTSGSSTSGKVPHILKTEEQSTDLQKEEEERQATRANLFKAYESEIGLLTPFIADAIEDEWKSGTPAKWIVDSFREAAAQNKRSWKYCAAILKRWVAQGNQNPVEKPTRKGEIPAQRIPSEPKSFDGIRQFLAEQGVSNG